MSLLIKELNINNFRNIESLNLNSINKLTIFLGPNAVGKTSIIEAIQLLTMQKSFRNSVCANFIKQGCECSYLSLNAKSEARNLTIAASVTAHSKKFTLNGKHKNKESLKGVLPSVVFTPDDLQLAKGSMSYKRNAIDSIGCEVLQNYYIVKRDYEKVIQHKNSLLKDCSNGALIESLNELVVTCGAQLLCYRFSLFNRLKAYMSAYYSEITKSEEHLTLQYFPAWVEGFDELDSSTLLDRNFIRGCLERKIQEVKHEESAKKCSVVGPHRDKITFFIDGRNVKDFASQGQQRSVVLAFKLAEIRLVEEYLGTKPILLLDDVMSELDEQRRNKLTEFIFDSTQTFITTTNISYFNDQTLQNASIVKLPV